MTTALEPGLAVAYVRELSTAVRAVVVLDAAGALLAGPPALLAPARAVLAAAPEALDLLGREPDGVVFAARTPTHAVVAVSSAGVPAGPTALDVRAAAEALASPAAAAAPAVTARTSHAGRDGLRGAVRALISAAHSAM